MNTILRFTVLIFIVGFGLKLSAQSLSAYVNPMIGTGGHGHTFPGPTIPFGACQLSPDTRLTGWDGCSGYHYSDSIIYGFSHTHLSGTGCSDYGDILLMPTNKEVSMKDYDYASVFKHSQEKASAGFYQVLLDKWKVKVNLTTTRHVGVHEYQYASMSEQFVVLDLQHRDEVLDTHFEILNDSTVQGYRFSKAWAKNQKVYFYIQFSKPFIEKRYGDDQSSSSQTTPIRFEKQRHILFSFGKHTNPLIVKVGISQVDEEGAKKNILQEALHWNFNKYKQEAVQAWENELSKIKIKDPIGSNVIKDKLHIFYTALYHCMTHPSIANDVDGRYRGRDDKIHNTNGKFDYYNVFSLWDTYRALHPLLTIIDKKRTHDFINTFIKHYEEGGRLPIWELSSNETNCMIGYHVVSVIWDAYNKGIRSYDANKAFEAMKAIATSNNDYTFNKSTNLLVINKDAVARCGDADALQSYCNYGYIRADDAHESVSKTLEYAYNDWCIAQMAKALNKSNDYAYYFKRSNHWKNVYDPTTGFMRAQKNGTLYIPFSPYTVDNNFTEANSWQYSLYAPHDMQGLQSIFGHKYQLSKQLDNLFNASEKTQGREQADITGLIGQYAHGNEPSHQIAYLYNYANEPWKTVERTNFILNNFYKNAPDGLIGNEDCGQMSAWLVMTAMGIYSVCPGDNTYQLTAPWFDNILINNSIPIQKKSSKNKSSSYFTIANKTNISHEQFVNSKTKTFHQNGNKSFRPQIPNINNNSAFVSNPFVVASPRIFKDQQKIELQCATPADIYYSISGSVFNKYSTSFFINDNIELSFYASSLNGQEKSPTQYATFTKLPTDRKVILKSSYNNSYSAGGAEAMIDGIYGKLNWRAGDWQGYQGQNVETIIEFDKPQKINAIAANYLEDQNSWIFYPKSVSFYVGTDSTNWTLLENISTNKSSHSEQVSIDKFQTNKANEGLVKYIKVVAENFGPMPNWHEGRGNETFIFIDEIEIK